MSIWKWLLIASLIVTAPMALAQEEGAPDEAAPVAEDAWAGKLLGDWGGARQDLADQGITFDLDITQIIQGNAHGGANTTNAMRYSSSSNMRLNLDFDKMDLIPGGSLMLHGEHRQGYGINEKVGSLSPVNFDAFLPGGGECVYNLSEWIYTQGLIPGKLVFIGGKLFGGNAFDTNAYANNETTQFLNVSLRNNPVIPPFLPYTNMGAGLIAIPTDWLTVLTAVADSEGQAKTTGFETAFHGPTHTSVIHEWDFKVKLGDLDGTQRIGFVWSSMETPHLNPITPFRETGPLLMKYTPRLLNLLKPYLPFDEAADNIALYYNFDQQLYKEADDPTQGCGLFGRFGWARDDVNPINYFYSLGVGGKGLVDGRDNDTYGIGYYHINLSDDLPDMFHSEQGVECYYSIQVTPWMTITPDLQFIVNPGGIDDNDVAVVYGVRAQMSL